MTRGKALNPKEYAMIIALRERKFSLKSIGRKVKCSKSTVAATIKRYEETGSFLPRERVKKKRLLSLKDDQYLRLISKRDRRKTLPAITQEFNMGRETPVSKSTIARSFKRMDIQERVAVKKPLLRKENMKKRLKFARNI